MSRSSKRNTPKSIERGIYAKIIGSEDEDKLLIEVPESQIRDAYEGVIAKVEGLLKSGGDYKIFCFIHLNSKQGPKVQVPGVTINLPQDGGSWRTFWRKYREGIMEMENRYIGGEEYNEQQLILSRAINVQFHYQVWEKA